MLSLRSSMTSNTKVVGNKAEEFACQFLKKLGFKVLERNFFIRGGEIDIIAKDGEIIVFVEVKARFTADYGLAIEAITPWKIQALKKSALFYLSKKHWLEKSYRFDLVTVDKTATEYAHPELIRNIIEG